MFEIDVAGRQEFNPWPHSPNAKAVALVDPGSVVLDLGCAGGHMAVELNKKDCSVYGVEIGDAKALEARASCVGVVRLNLDVVEVLPYWSRQFDYVLALDLLEHLRRPDRVLGMIKPLLKRDGKLICSIPNVARLEHRLNLLRGRFDYGTGGALSKGHLRFFTRKTARDMLEEAGFVNEQELPTGLCSMIGGWWPTLLSYQFLFVSSAAGQANEGDA